MPYSILTGPVPAKIWTDINSVESEALTQIRQITKLPWAFHHVAIMPDCHSGKGSVVGSVIAMKNAVSPALCGVDLGCGMAAIKTNLKASDLPENLDGLRAAIEAAIPVGFNYHERAVFLRDQNLRNQEKSLFERFKDLPDKVQTLESKAGKQLGTLGGGNHFIEVCLDDGRCFNCSGTGKVRYHNGGKPLPVGFPEKLRWVACDYCGIHNGKNPEGPNVWLMLHSGSRNIGKELAEIHINIARKLAHNEELPNKDLAVFLAGTEEMKAYRRDLFWAQTYALLNRNIMLYLFKNVMKEQFPQIEFDDPILCHHNYVAEEIHFGEEVFITRKGAINAEAGRLGIIPGSMGDKSFIVRGLGNPESFNSASHGAGRKMSRGAAKRAFTQEDLIKQTAGVCCRKDTGVIDEIPGAYKDINEVMKNQNDLVEIVTELKQCLCVKG